MFAMFFIGFLLGIICVTVAVLSILNYPRAIQYLDDRAVKTGYSEPPFNLRDINQQ